MDAIVLLKGDHETVEKLFREFEQAGDRAHKAKRQLAAVEPDVPHAPRGPQRARMTFMVQPRS
ncbi:hypothetical protein ACWGKQ_04800 [Streptomyces sp. NPDC054770]